MKIACYWDQPVFDFDMFKFHPKLVDPNSMLFLLRTRSKCQEETLQNMASEEEACLYQILMPYFGGFLLGIWIVKIACYWDQPVLMKFEHVKIKFWLIPIACYLH